MDEAHNIEDVAREAGSFTVNEDQLSDIEHQLQRNIQAEFCVEDHRAILFLIQQLQDWMLNTSAKVLVEKLDNRVKTFGDYFLHIFTELQRRNLEEQKNPFFFFFLSFSPVGMGAT